MKQKNPAPTRKVQVGALVGALISIAVWLYNNGRSDAKDKIPAELATSITTVLTFVVSYLVPPSETDQIQSNLQL